MVFSGTVGLGVVEGGAPGVAGPVPGVPLPGAGVGVGCDGLFGLFGFPEGELAPELFPLGFEFPEVPLAPGDAPNAELAPLEEGVVPEVSWACEFPTHSAPAMKRAIVCRRKIMRIGGGILACVSANCGAVRRHYLNDGDRATDFWEIPQNTQCAQFRTKCSALLQKSVADAGEMYLVYAFSRQIPQFQRHERTR
jgi:hypothetical protein